MRISIIVQVVALLNVGALAVPIAGESSAIQSNQFNRQDGILARDIKGAAEGARLQARADSNESRKSRERKSKAPGKDGKTRSQRKIHVAPPPKLFSCTQKGCFSQFSSAVGLAHHLKLHHGIQS
ncbi:hypothetical protein PgNI_05517 [Pyricularia grisea]|uniref:C2H2-type domain-containing protein n=1 Tax=Pyricularia grisea TaxID=148305 RepID=A0A6P8B525_PYRGI|nr:hypothetical protein PgNI_05517 [Pyricularia grisea]TLD10360.1 hypothetical protein PgNI_05517 [Pyricularia grisea]